MNQQIILSTIGMIAQIITTALLFQNSHKSYKVREFNVRVDSVSDANRRINALLENINSTISEINRDNETANRKSNILIVINATAMALQMFSVFI